MMLYETEQCHARARRYLSPEEYPFFPGDALSRASTGKFVAESKFAADADAFRDLAARGDVPGIHALLENVAVEDNVVRRAMLKAVTFGQDAFSGMDPGYKVEPTLVASIYRNMIIPLTKQVQVTYLLERLGHGDKVQSSPTTGRPTSAPSRART
ncbi:chorismate mutase [Aureococcus anophagefferens]|nr:chorismate mutase [Aureococcus anophagefferens]